MQIHEDKRYQELIERIEHLHIENCTDEMLLLLEQLQTLSEKEQDPIGLAASYFYRDILSDDKPGCPSYMQYAKRSLKIAENQNIPYYQMKASNSIGIMYSEISDFHNSLEHYLCALRIAEEHPEFRYSSIVLNNVGNLFVWLKDYADAVIYLEHAYYKSIDEKKDHVAINIILLNLIELYFNLDNDEKIHQWEALSHNILDKDVRDLISCIILIHEAKHFVKNGDTNSAIDKINKFIERSQVIPDYIYIFHCCVSALKLCIDLGDFALSSALMEQLEQTQSNSTMTSFSYDFSTIKMAYYQAFYTHVGTDYYTVCQEYYTQSQDRITQLHNTYARSLSMKIEFEAVKHENQNVQMLNKMLQKNIELDIFTSLYNKTSTEKYVRAAMQERPSSIKQGFLLIDIDLFKRINDNYGHGLGDEVITSVASILNNLDVGDKIAGRFGGDEFLVFLKNMDSVDAIREVAETLLSQPRNNIHLPDTRVPEVTLSIGICVIDSPMDFKEAFTLADEALYEAKEHGRNQYKIKSSPSNAS